MNSGAYLVSGGSSGIGAAIAGRLVAAGHRVGIISRMKGRRTPDVWSQDVQRIDWIKADLADEGATLREVDAWSKRINCELDGVILSAIDYGDAPRHQLISSTLSEFDQLWAVNLRSQFLLLSAVLPNLVRRPRAVILSISSCAALEASPGRALYSATKAGSLALLRSLAEELRSTTVSVVQALPRNQVHTPGIQSRRPPGFDFNDYDKPTIFDPFVAHIASTLGAGLNGCVLSIDNRGRWHDITSTLPQCK